jgi:hypothetical protein
MTLHDYTSLIGETSIIKNSVHRQAENLLAFPTEFRNSVAKLWQNYSVRSDFIGSSLHPLLENDWIRSGPLSLPVYGYRTVEVL